MTYIKSLIILALFVVLTNTSYSQVSSAVISVDGFTCSLCAKGVEGQLKELSFIKSVKTDLKNASFTLAFNGKTININELRNAVTDGGFSVNTIKITASGEIEGDTGSGFVFKTNGIPSLFIQEVPAIISSGEKVTITGILSSSNSLKVKSLKKI